MCGRAAQSATSINHATQEFGTALRGHHQASVGSVGRSRHHLGRGGDGDGNHQQSHSTSQADTAVAASATSGALTESEWNDNFNLSPGMDCAVIYLDRDGSGSSSTVGGSSGTPSSASLRVQEMKWGLITKNGSPAQPLYDNDKDIMKMCFERLCFNARSDTLFEKPTFARLAHNRRSCIVAFDGYFEWKTTIAKQKKQPYFVYRRREEEQQCEQHDRCRPPPLLIAGLWTCVSTGRTDEPTMYSFTIVTTEACEQISWLHDRMPICIWDHELALQWLEDPSPKVLKQLDDAARKNQQQTGFGWHKVKPEMTSLKYRSSDTICEYKDPTQSVKAFFAVKKIHDDSGVVGIKDKKKNDHDGQKPKAADISTKDEAPMATSNKRLTTEVTSKNFPFTEKSWSSSQSPAAKKSKLASPTFVTGSRPIRKDSTRSTKKQPPSSTIDSKGSPSSKQQRPITNFFAPK